MARDNRRKTRQYQTPYVTGTAAPAYGYNDEGHEAQAFDHGLQSGQNPVAKKKISVNPLYTMVLISLVFIMLLICVMILKAQFTVAATTDEVLLMKQQLTDIRRENAHLEAIIHTELDLVAIKATAMEEYGMIYPTDTEVIRIYPKVASYTIQYTAVDAPVKERTSIGNVLAFITRGW